MPPVEQQINIIATFDTKFQKLGKAISDLEDLNRVISKDTYEKALDAYAEEYAQTESKARKEIDKTAKTRERSDKKGERQSKKSMKGMGDAAKALSITLPLMFGFQKVSEDIKSLVDPAMDLVGVQSTYQQFLAIKYLPTALKQLDVVLEQGDAWDEQSEAQRETEGDMLLAAQQMSDFITYAAQMATTLGAIGEILPNIDLAPFGVGIEITGRGMGSAAGLAIALAGGISLLGTEGGIAATSFSSFGAQVMLNGTDKMAAFLEQVQIATGTSGDSLPTLGDDLDTTKDKTDNFGGAVNILWGGLKDISKDWPVDIISSMTGIDPKQLKKDLDALASITYPMKIVFNPFGFLGTVWDVIKWFWKQVNGGSSGGSSLSSAFVSNPFNSQGGNNPFTSMATGGIVPYTGLVNMHKGETVIPAGQSLNSSPTFNIQASVSSDMDVRRLADQLSKYWVNDMERISKSRGII